MLKPKSSNTTRSFNSTIAINKVEKLQPKAIQKKTLSSQIQFVPAPDIDKISLVHHNITLLDRVLIKGFNSITIDNTKIKMLYLSNNFISDIEHIQQFPRLQTLSLSYNNISKLTNARYLSSLSLLSHLSLQGNPISKSPMYTSYIVGVIQNAKNRNFKILDKSSISMQIRREAIGNWDVYEQSMGELIKNYMKLIYIVQFWKKQSINRIVRRAEKQLKEKMKYNILRSENLPTQQICRDSEQESNSVFKIDKKFMFFLSQAESDIPSLPTKFLMSIQNILNDDVGKILEKCMDQEESDSQKQENYITIQDQYLSEDRNQFLPLKVNKNRNLKIQEKNSQLEIYFYSMFDLQQRQRSKICEMKAKIEDKLDSDESIQAGDVNIVQCILSNVLYPPPDSQSKKYYEWKVLDKMFMRMKKWVKRNKTIKFAAGLIAQLISREVEENLLLGMTRIHGQVKRKKLERVAWILNMKKMGRQRQGFKLIKSWIEIRKQICAQLKNDQDSQKQRFADSYYQLKIKQFHAAKNQRKLLKICFSSWSRVTAHSKLSVQNSVLHSKIRQHQLREQKMQNKINLLNQLLTAMEEKTKRHIDQQFGNPKSILKQIEQSLSNNLIFRERTYRTECRSPESRLYESQVYQDRDIELVFSPRNQLKQSRIRKNILIDKENIKNNSNKQIGFQRKLNSSNRLLKIQNQRSKQQF